MTVQKEFGLLNFYIFFTPVLKRDIIFIANFSLSYFFSDNYYFRVDDILNTFY